MKLILIPAMAILSIAWSCTAVGQESVATNEDAMSAYDKHGSKSFEQLEKAGKLSVCSLGYSYSFRDFKNRDGHLVQVVGYIKYFFPDKPSFSLVTQETASEIFLDKNGKLQSRNLKPTYFGLVSGGVNLDKYKTTLENCSNNKVELCNLFADTDSSLSENFLKGYFQPLEISITTLSNGYDTKFAFEKLEESDKSKPVTYDSKMEFFQCISKVVSSWSSNRAN